MADESKTKPRLEIAHVLFIDIVGYSKLLTDEQSEALQELNQVVRKTDAARHADAAGQLTILPTGDGMALVFTGSVEEPVECALEISQALRAQPSLPVRMGIHSGPVHQVKDANDRENIAGVGINIAQRVMDCGDAGHILVSKRVADDLAQRRRWQPYLHELGDVEVKHGVVVSLVNLYAETIGNPTPPARLGKISSRIRSGSGTRKGLSPLVRAIFIVVALILALAIVSVIFAPAILRSLGKGQVTSTPQVPAIPSPPSIGDAIQSQVAKKVTDALQEALSSEKHEDEARSHPIRSLAVLPLDNYSDDKSQDYFAEGMTDELTTDLATISQLRVISRSSTTQFTGKKRPSTPEIAKMLNVDAIVEGSVRRAGDKVRITAQLIDARADRHLWAKSFERDSRDVLALQSELASAIANEIKVRLTPSEQARLTSARSVNPEAYDAYLKGRYFFNRPSDENLSKAITQFEEAVRLDPNFAPAYSGLSDAYLWAAFNEGFVTSADAKSKTKAAAEKALALNPGSAEAHTSLANYKSWYEHDWAGADKEFPRAIELNPNYAFAHDQFALSLACQGRFDESVAEGRRATELDPLDPAILVDNTLAFAGQGNFQKAKEEAQRAADLDPTFFFPQMQFGWIDLQQGNVRTAIPALEKANAMQAPPFVAAYLGYAYGAAGDKMKALAMIEEIKKKGIGDFVPPFNLAIVYLGLGDHTRAMDYLEQAQAADSQWMMYLKVDRIFDPLRDDPRFIALMKKCHFEK